MSEDWTLCERAKRHLSGNECPHIPTDGESRSGFGCDRCTQTLIEDVERAAVAAQKKKDALIAKEFLSLPETPYVSVEAVKTAIAAAIRKETS